MSPSFLVLVIKWMKVLRYVGVETPVKYPHRNGHWSSIRLSDKMFVLKI